MGEDGVCSINADGGGGGRVRGSWGSGRSVFRLIIEGRLTLWLRILGYSLCVFTLQGLRESQPLPRTYIL